MQSIGFGSRHTAKQPGTEQNASDNITQPVHAGNQPPHNHKGGECRQQGKKNVQNSRPADAAVQLFIKIP